MAYKRASTAWRSIAEKGEMTSIYAGDSAKLIQTIPDAEIALTVTSPPYCMGKEYEGPSELDSFVQAHEYMLPEVVRATADGGSICWQVGHYVRNGILLPLEYIVAGIMARFPEMQLRNRIVWTFGSGLHCQNRFSGRHEVVLWYTKGNNYVFNLDDVRIPQKYPGKKYSRGANKGEYSGNPLGKNPGDVWEIPNVKANHTEKTDHPCQFPVGLVQRLVRALTGVGDIVFDPYMGSGSTAVACTEEGRRFIGAEVLPEYIAIAEERIADSRNGKARIRPLDLPLYIPKITEKVAQKPAFFAAHSTVQ